MICAVFLPAYHDDDELSDVVDRALAANTKGLKLCHKPGEHRLAWLPRVIPGWSLLWADDRRSKTAPEAA